jgi:uncharacterized protein
MSGLVVAGYASLFGMPDLAGDIVERGAFAASLDAIPAARIAMLFQHDPARAIGHWTEVREDDDGLWVKGTLDLAFPVARQVLSLVQTGTAEGLSIGFRAIDAAPRPQGGRILKTIDLREVSIVTFPMLPRARLRLRAGQPSPHFTTPNQSAA